VITELLDLAKQVPDALETICDSPDLVVPSQPFRRVLLDRAAEWCSVVRKIMGSES